MYKRKKSPRVKARVSHTKRKVKRAVKRRKPMAKKKSTWDEPPAQDQEDDDTEASEFSTEEGQDQATDQHNEGEVAQTGQEPTSTEASEEGVYLVDSNEIAIKNQMYKRGDRVTLSPEELEQVQAAGVRILPVG